MTRPADRALRRWLAVQAAVVAAEWCGDVAVLWIAATGFSAAIGALGQWCLTRADAT